MDFHARYAVLRLSSALRYNVVTPMILLEVADNPNCPTVDLRVFHDLAPPQPVSQVRLERTPGHPQWYEITGWMRAGTPCSAFVQKVDDSGEGVAFLIYGGDAGLRLRPAGHSAPWRLDDAAQWGEPFLLVSDLSDVRLAQPPDGQGTTARSAVHG